MGLPYIDRTKKDISAIRRLKREYLNKMFLIIVFLRKMRKIKNKNYLNSYTVQKTSLINSTFSVFLCLSTGLAWMIKHSSCLHYQGKWQETVKSSTFLSSTFLKKKKFSRHLVPSCIRLLVKSLSLRQLSIDFFRLWR